MLTDLELQNFCFRLVLAAKFKLKLKTRLEKKPCVRRGRIDYYQPHFGDVPEVRKVVTNSRRNESFFKQIENHTPKFTSGTTNRTLGTSPNYCKERAICPLLRQCFFSRLQFTNACHTGRCLAPMKQKFLSCRSVSQKKSLLI